MKKKYYAITTEMVFKKTVLVPIEEVKDIERAEKIVDAAVENCTVMVLDEDGNPTQWSSEINHPKYGKYCWINDMGDYFGVEVDYGGFIELVECKSLISAKRWVATQLMNSRK